MGGIVARHPTTTSFHDAGPHLPADRDLFGDVARDAHARKTRLIRQLDMSKTQTIA